MVFSSRKYEFEDLVPLHAEIAKWGKAMNICMLFLGACVIGLIAGMVVVDEIRQQQVEKLAVFEPDSDGNPSAQKALLKQLELQSEKLTKDAFSLLGEVENSEEMDLLVRVFPEHLPKWSHTIQNNIDDTKAILEKLKKAGGKFLVPASKPLYQRYYSKYLAGYVGQGCDAETCPSPSQRTSSLEQCIEHCYEKRIDGVFSLNFDMNTKGKNCYCSTVKFDFFAKPNENYIHYRFPSTPFV